MKKIFIRFGELPPTGKSKIHNGDAGIIGEEIGVSVYEGIEEDGKIKVILPSLTPMACVSLSGCLGRKIFIVNGEKIGEGTDGEPLLKNVKKLN